MLGLFKRRYEVINLALQKSFQKVKLCAPPNKLYLSKAAN